MKKSLKKKDESLKIPHNSVNEQIVIAAAITHKKSRDSLLNRVRSDMFIADGHSDIWETIKNCVKQDLDPVPSTLAQLNDKIDQSYLDELVEQHPTAPKNVNHHMDSLFWDATRAKAVSGPITSLMRSLQDPKSDPARVRALAGQVSTSFKSGPTRQFQRDPNQLVVEVKDLLKSRRMGVALYPTGIDELDFYGADDFGPNGDNLEGEPLLIPGLAPGKITVVTAISGGGKSTLTALLALKQAEMGRKILYGPWEMGAEETLLLLSSIAAEIPRSKVQSGDFTHEQELRLAKASAGLSKYIKFVEQPFHREKGVRHSIDEVLDEIHAYIADSGCEVVIFDLWRRAFRTMRPEEEEMALYRMQAIVEECQVHCILVQQQRLKEVEKRNSPRPTRDGIKGSSAWVDIADLILGVHIPSLTTGTPCTSIETLVLKQRYGKWPIAITHQWDGDLVRLSNGHVTAYDPGSEDDLDGGSKAWLKRK